VVQQFTRRVYELLLALQLEVVAAVADSDPQTRFDLPQMRIERTTQSGQLAAVVGFQSDLMGW